MVKVGVRKPNLKSSIKARTTGKAKRALKRKLIPGYGKKGAGWVTNPKKAAYNYVYNRTTVGVGDIAKAATKKKPEKKRAASTKQAPAPEAAVQQEKPAVEKRKTGIGFLLVGILFAVSAVYGFAQFEASLTWVLTELIIIAVAAVSLVTWWNVRSPSE